MPRWVAEVEGGRPYAGWPALREAAEQSAAASPRTSSRPRWPATPGSGSGPARATTPSTPTREQAGVDPADRDTASRLAAGNAAYEDRFDRVFLIRAAGRSADEILAELERRLDNDDGTERDETVRQLGEIAVLRLESAV